MDLSILENIVLDQEKSFLKKELGLEREIGFSKYLKTNQTIVISGIRRCGKSTLLRQFAEKMKDFYYINFDDERLDSFRIEDFNNLLLIWKKRKQSKNILIDEIQNVPKWEKFVRRVHDEDYKVFVSGSNSKLLASELATHLTGRYFKIELYPFSFHEFLRFHKIEIDGKTTDGKAKILRKFDQYLNEGGMPEYLRYSNPDFLKRTYEDIIYRDIVSRFGVRDVKSFKQLSNYLFSNFTKEQSYNSLSSVLGIKSVATVKSYISFLEESYLLFELYKYDFSLKKQFVSDKKVYVIDNGIRNTIAFHFTDDKGQSLENMVFLELKRRDMEVYFFKDKKECDFIILEKNKITEALQVTTQLAENKEREIAGLLEAMSQFKLKTGTIITENQEDEINIGEFNIHVVPAWKWLLGKDRE